MAQALVRLEPHFEQSPGLELATAVDGLSQHTAQCVYRAASQGQLGKAWSRAYAGWTKRMTPARLPASLSLMITKLRTWSRLVGALVGT